ncbi:hypothetical protein TWF718_010099 [Orbilia javanica]|uniref:Uncharacterized protein n=1 Tax=Orbilia javanica TaxID=47235 RepID=A0AAN8MRR3_9PEZI
MVRAHVIGELVLPSKRLQRFADWAMKYLSRTDVPWLTIERGTLWLGRSLRNILVSRVEAFVSDGGAAQGPLKGAIRRNLLGSLASILTCL